MATLTPTPLTMKLLIDRKAQRVLFAEASKEAIDLLFSLLALPFATAMTVAEPGLASQTAGGMGNLYASAEKLGSTYRPASSLLLMPEASFEPSRVFFRCRKNYSNCGSRGSEHCMFYMTDVQGTLCPNCAYEMTATLHYVSPTTSGSRRSGPGQSAQSTPSGGRRPREEEAEATYTVLDDLTIKPHRPMSAISAITLLGTMGVTDLGAVEERTVRLNNDEGLGILMASLHSKTVLTDVFLGEIRR